MNSKQKYIIVVALILITAVLIWWIGSGGEILSKDGIWIEKPMTELDKALGSKPQLEFKEQFTLGLIPHVAVFSGVVGLISALLFFIFKKKKTKEIQ
jgi:hypothetical protein